MVTRIGEAPRRQQERSFGSTVEVGAGDEKHPHRPRAPGRRSTCVVLKRLARLGFHHNWQREAVSVWEAA
jgi:hypothetical protein